jgi:glucokinase
MANRDLNKIVDDLEISSKILGLNINGMKTIAVYGDMNGLIYEHMQMETPTELPFAESFEAVCCLVDKLLKICRAQGLSSPKAISVAVSGPVDLKKGSVIAPQDLPTWVDAPLKGRLGVRYNLPVMIEHRSAAAALAEGYFGAGIGVENLVFVDLEPIVSLGIIVDGMVYHGGHDAAGDIGRMRMTATGPAGLGETGSLTGFASGPGMAELAHLRFPEKWPTPPQPYSLVQAVNQGDAEALAVVAEAADHLGKALLWLILTLDPDLVVFGHPGDVLGEALLSPLRDAVLKYGGGEARQLPLLSVSKLGAKLDDTTALMAVVDRFKRRNSTPKTGA